jgi:hypothetical protein
LSELTQSEKDLSDILKNYPQHQTQPKISH